MLPLKYNFLKNRLCMETGVVAIKKDVIIISFYVSATTPNRTTVTVSQASRAFSESDGTVTIFIEREGDLALVSVVM